jgi:trans-aconitate 2-methyltransferase
MSTTWDPALYLDFDDHRARPFHDLLARVGAAAPRRVVDLGCGPGHLTGVLAARWPKAAVSALDSSAEMVAAAVSGGSPPSRPTCGTGRRRRTPTSW